MQTVCGGGGVHRILSTYTIHGALKMLIQKETYKEKTKFTQIH